MVRIFLPPEKIKSKGGRIFSEREAFFHEVLVGLAFYTNPG